MLMWLPQALGTRYNLGTLIEYYQGVVVLLIVLVVITQKITKTNWIKAVLKYRSKEMTIVKDVVSKKTTMMVYRERNHISGFEEGEVEYGPWSDLHFEILNIIFGKLNVVDQIQFRSVCKSWEQLRVGLNKKFPWLMGHDWSFHENGSVLSLCNFHIPSPFQSHLSANKIEGEEWKVLHGAEICASKYGWLLLQNTTMSFLYNPFTKNIIELPPLDVTFNRSTFSSVPTSPDCCCLTIQSSKSCSEINLSICSPGDQSWSTYIFQGFQRAIEDVVYSNGAFYCVFTGGVLGAFCVADRHWSLLTDMEPIPGVFFDSRARMVESNGELWLVCPSSCPKFLVFRFNWSKMDWVRAYKLGYQAFFLGCTSFSVSAEGETSDFAEKIYYQYDMYTSYYSLETKRSFIRCKFYPWIIERETERVWIQLPEV